MADISITPASVIPASNAIKTVGTSGGTLVQGKAVYLDAATNTWKLADNDDATAAVHKATGIALNGASAGQPCAVQTGGDITIGATIVGGTSYYLSGTAGGICPLADVTSGHEVVLIGIGKSTTLLQLSFQQPGVTL